MEHEFLSLQGIEKSASYQGPLILLKKLEYSQGYAKPKCRCGRTTDLTRVYKAPKVLLQPLSKRGLLAQVGIFEDVVLFDYYHLELWIAGYREDALCAKCFFDNLFFELGPTCPLCRKTIRQGKRVHLYPLTESNWRKWSKMIKVLSVLRENDRLFVSCCKDSHRQSPTNREYFWTQKGLISSKKA
jgi:hypothetical protein